MKKTLSIITLFFLLTTSFAQNVIKYNKTKYYFGDSLNSSGRVKSIAKLYSSYYLGLDAYSDSLLFTSYVVKTDLFGNEIKRSIRFGSDSVAYFIGTGNGLIIDSDSNIVVIGGCVRGGEWGGFAIKLNCNLDTIWVKHFLFPDSLVGFACDTPRHKFEAIKQTLDGGFIIVGSYFKDCISTVNNLRTYLLKLDTDGNVEWRMAYDDLINTYDIELTSDSGYIFLSLPTRGFDLVKTDKNGNQQWKYSIDNNYVHRIGQDIEFLNDSIVFVAGQYIYDEIGNNPNAADIYKVNINNQQKIWEKRYYLYQDFKCILLHQSLTLNILDNQNILISGTARVVKYDSTAGGYKGIMLMLNSNGDSLWSRYYGNGDFSENCQFNDIILTDDGGFLAAGYRSTYYGNYYDGAWLVKMDSLGFSPGSYTLSVCENVLVINKKPLLYPNPAQNNINLQFEESPPSRFTILIYNSAGVLVKIEEQTACEQEYRISIEDLETGVYFIQINSENKSIFNSKFIKL